MDKRAGDGDDEVWIKGLEMGMRGRRGVDKRAGGGDDEVWIKGLEVGMTRCG